MRSINSRFTYLLTYLLTYSAGVCRLQCRELYRRRQRSILSIRWSPVGRRRLAVTRHARRQRQLGRNGPPSGRLTPRGRSRRPRCRPACCRTKCSVRPRWPGAWNGRARPPAKRSSRSAPTTKTVSDLFQSNLIALNAAVWLSCARRWSHQRS